MDRLLLLLSWGGGGGRSFSAHLSPIWSTVDKNLSKDQTSALHCHSRDIQTYKCTGCKPYIKEGMTRFHHSPEIALRLASLDYLTSSIIIIPIYGCGSCSYILSLLFVFHLRGWLLVIFSNAFHLYTYIYTGSIQQQFFACLFVLGEC